MVARVCSHHGCPELTPCPHHPPREPWANPSARNHHRPSDFKERKNRALQRDAGQCYWCGQPGATTVDHIRAVADGGSWHETNLAAIHTDCHHAKTAAERQARTVGER